MRIVPWTLLSVLLSACSTTQSGFTFVAVRESPRAADCNVEILRRDMPLRPFVRISRIDVHIERTFFADPTFADAVPELRRQACLSGADAVIEVREERDAIVENRSYHVTATGVKYVR